MKTEQVQFLKKVTGAESFPFVQEEVASTTSGFVVSEDALEKLIDAAMGNSAAADQVTQLTQQLNDANTARTTAEENLATANTAKKKAEDDLATANARIEELESEAGITQTTKESDKGPKTAKKGYDADADPINMIADNLLGKPKAKEA